MVFKGGVADLRRTPARIIDEAPKRTVYRYIRDDERPARALPVLLVWGDRDRMVTHRGSRHLVEALGHRADFAYELYEGCGHCPQVEMPERLTASVLAFTCS
jgi:pimeloyl-ACP methyl ester carboxylesterase